MSGRFSFLPPGSACRAVSAGAPNVFGCRKGGFRPFPDDFILITSDFICTLHKL